MFSHPSSDDRTIPQIGQPPSPERLMTPSEVRDELPLAPAIREHIQATRMQVRCILTGIDHRLLVIAGPCSIHDVDAAMEYAHWLRGMSETFGEALLIIMRAYVEKPRTLSGWKGLVSDPYIDGSFKMNEGLRLARKLLIDINSTGVATATEFVNPVTTSYIEDLVSWGAIGARTSESQVHRELASGLSCPIGFKNGTAGNLRCAVNGILAARKPQCFLSILECGVVGRIATSGNPDCHLVLRGGIRPNYDAQSVRAAVALLRSCGLPEHLMIDCSHSNCGDDYREQLTVAEHLLRYLRDGSQPVIGTMIESNLVPGKQALNTGQQLIFGQSITDGCLGLADTERLLCKLADSKALRKTQTQEANAKAASY